jgi:cysteine desulfurase/selenocysteine lyase
MWIEAHETIASFINAKSYREIVMVRNATEGINLVAKTFGSQFVEEGDVIAISEMEHHSNIVPWQLLGAKIEWIPVLNDYTLDLEYVDYLVRKYREKLKLVSVVHVSNVLGVENSVKQLKGIVKQYGTKLMLDVAQSIQHQKVDVADLGCDFLVFSGHKLFGPTGSGAVYIDQEVAEQLEPWMGGGEMISSVSKTKSEWNALPWKFEAGTPNIVGGVGLAAAIRWFVKSFDYNLLQKHEKQLLDTALAGLKSIPKVEIVGPTSSENRKGLIAFTVGGVHPHDIAGGLDEKGIAIRAGYHCAEPLHKKLGIGPTARVSFAPYNTLDEVRYFLNSLKQVISYLR